MDNSIVFENVTKKYGSNYALNNINFTHTQGRITGILGPNGSGKTTLIKIIAGMLTDYHGKVSIRGHPPGDISKIITSYMPDRIKFPLHLSSRDLIEIYKSFFMDFDTAKAENGILNLNISIIAPLNTLSKGTQEKISLILTVCRKAKFIILDEPLSGIDPASRDYIIKTILKNVTKESSLLLSTHFISETESIFDDVIFLDEGKIVMEGSAEKIREDNNSSLHDLFIKLYYSDYEKIF